MSYTLFDICGCFDVPGFELSMLYSIAATSKSKNSVQTCFEINNKFALGQVRDLLLGRTCLNYYFYSYYDFWLE